jgi:xanthine dehydrogenase accessory factor
MLTRALKDCQIIIKGAGEMATGVACRLYRANFTRILMLETPAPLAVRRRVSFCEAVFERSMTVEGIDAVRIEAEHELIGVWETRKIAVMVDPQGLSIARLHPDVLIDATLAKRNLGTSRAAAPLVIALGPGFIAGKDAHLVIETNRGHDLGRLIHAGEAAANTGIPGEIGGYTKERVIRSPGPGIFATEKQIGDFLVRGELLGKVDSLEVRVQLDGVLRGLIRPGSLVTQGLKIGDIDPRGEASYCNSISEKARSLGGAVLEAILAVYNR